MQQLIGNEKMTYLQKHNLILATVRICTKIFNSSLQSKVTVCYRVGGVRKQVTLVIVARQGYFIDASSFNFVIFALEDMKCLLRLQFVFQTNFVLVMFNIF